MTWGLYVVKMMSQTNYVLKFKINTLSQWLNLGIHCVDAEWEIIKQGWKGIYYIFWMSIKFFHKLADMLQYAARIWIALKNENQVAKLKI